MGIRRPIFLILIVFEWVSCLQVYFGECPVYYEEPCRLDTVKFILSTRIRNATRFYQLDPHNLRLPDGFDFLTPLKILIHGYGGLVVDQAIKNVTQAYQDIGYNVILVDWGVLSAIPCYTTAYLNTWHVGQCVAILAVSLIPLGITPNFLHLIGFSLGAHIAGFAGTHMRKIVGFPIRRITGLDPALPFFATLKRDWKLDPSDANFVDVLHTSAGSFGKIEAAGHVDFYINGGFLQPACHAAPYPPLCSHIMAGMYFAESIRGNRNFVGQQCENLANYLFGFCMGRKRAIMGEFTDAKSRGVYFVETADRPPFALGPYNT